MNEPRVVYFAGPLFTQAERRWNAELVERLRTRGLTLLVPQDQAREYLATQRDGFQPERDAPVLFRQSVESIEKADVVVAIFDGPDPDSGTAFECGVAWKSGKPVVGVRTDLRGGGDGAGGVNLMLSESSASMVVINAVLDTPVDAVADAIAAAVGSLPRR